MLRQDSSRIEPESDGLLNSGTANTVNQNGYAESPQNGGVDIQAELERLKDIIFASVRLPFIRYTLIDEEQLLDQIELIQYSLPKAFEEAKQIVEHQDSMILEARQYAEELVLSAQRQAAEILDDMELVRQARLAAQQIRQEVQRDCEQATEQTLTEIERVKRQAEEDLEEMRRRAIAEAEAIQRGADEYADDVLLDIEQRLGEMMRLIRNGRQLLQGQNPAPRPNPPHRGSDRPKN